MLAKDKAEFYKSIFEKKIKDKGLFFTIKKIISRIVSLDFLIIYPIVSIICLLIVIIKPIIFIRFGSLNAHKIGPFVMVTEMGICEQENGIQPDNKKTLNIYHLGHSNYICNTQLLKMWSRVLRVIPFAKYFYNVLSLFNFSKAHIISASKHGRDMYGLLEKTSPHIDFTDNEIIQAKKELLGMNIKDKDKYVLLINRGSKFLKINFPDFDTSHNRFRNSSISNYLLMAENLTKKNNTVIRVGQFTDEPIKSNNKKIIDYDREGFRTDLLDIYLSKNCRYIVGCDTGFAYLPGYLFRKPTVIVNWAQLEYLIPYLKDWLFLFRKYWLKNEKRFMRVPEIIKSKAGRFHTYLDYQKKGIELIENTPEEINEVVDEMEKKLTGNFDYSEEDNYLQKCFWSHFEKSDLFGVARGRIGKNFLRNNKDLFLN